MNRPSVVPRVPCPHCGSWHSRVKDSRSDARGYRRKRRCDDCERTFYTIERPEKQQNSPFHNI